LGKALDSLGAVSVFHEGISVEIEAFSSVSNIIQRVPEAANNYGDMIAHILALPG
jgi:hypothetical protein